MKFIWPLVNFGRFSIVKIFNLNRMLKKWLLSIIKGHVGYFFLVEGGSDHRRQATVEAVSQQPHFSLARGFDDSASKLFFQLSIFPIFKIYSLKGKMLKNTSFQCRIFDYVVTGNYWNDYLGTFKPPNGRYKPGHIVKLFVQISLSTFVNFVQFEIKILTSLVK